MSDKPAKIGANRLLASLDKAGAIVRPVHVSVRIGEPIPTAGLTLADRDALIERVRARIRVLLDEGPVWT